MTGALPTKGADAYSYYREGYAPQSPRKRAKNANMPVFDQHRGLAFDDLFLAGTETEPVRRPRIP